MYKIIQMIEPKRLKALRLHFNLNQQDFAESIGISQGSYSRIEKGLQPIPSESVGLILKRYRVLSDWLFFGEGGEKPVFIDQVVPRTQFEAIEKKLFEAQEELLKYQKKEIENLKKSGDVPDKK